jgi:outer membrane protein TolC
MEMKGLSPLMRTCFAAAIICLNAAGLWAQTGNQSSASNAYYGSVTAEKVSDEVMPLSLDDAIQLGIKNNLALTLARDDQNTANASKLQSLNPLLPNLSLEAETGAHQYNLAAQGFSPSIAAKFGQLLQVGGGGTFSEITRADVTTAQVNFSQTLFSWSLLDQYRAAKAGERVAFYNMQSSRGLVVLNVGTAYLQALAAGAQVQYADALVKTAGTLLQQAVEEHKAGTVANLEELRARVQFQAQQQALIVAQNNFEKSKIALEREIGIPAGQKIQLTDTSPYAELEAMAIEDAKQKAYANRQDYQGLQAQLRQAQLRRDAAKHERLPSLTFGGFYGVTGVSGQVFHGVMAAQGELQIPLFQEAKFRGDRDVAEANLGSTMQQLADLRSRIEAQLRDSLLDVQSAAELVRVGKSNVELATTALQQTTDRFQAGVDDNLPVVQAESTLSSAQTQYVQSVYRYNQAKLGLARNLGIVDTQYKAYLQGGK